MKKRIITNQPSGFTKLFTRHWAQRAAIILGGLALLGSASAAIPVPAGGSAIQDFSSIPAATEWSTQGIGSGSGGDDEASIDGSVQGAVATSITAALTSKSASATSSTAYWRDASATAPERLCTQATSIKTSLLMATLQNTSGATINDLNVHFDFGLATITPGEAFKGHRIYWSTTGLANSWTAAGNALATSPGSTPVDIGLGSLSWADSTNLYVIWADDNGASNPDGDFTIDNVSFTPLAPQANISSFTATGRSATISGTNINLTVPYGTNVASLISTFTMSGGATCDHVSGSAYDFTSPVHYIVTSSDTLTVKDYTVTITVAPFRPAYSVSFDAIYNGGGGVISYPIPTADTFGPPGTPAEQANWNSVHASVSVNFGPSGGNLTLQPSSTIVDSNGSNPVTLTVSKNNQGGNDGGGTPTNNLERLYFTGLRDNDGNLRISVDPLMASYSVYVYTGSAGSGFSLGTNYTVTTGLSGPLLLNLGSGTVRGFSIVDSTVTVTPHADILTFGLPGNSATISGTSITLTVPFGTDVTSLAPTFTMSSGATCDHTSGSPYDFTNPVHYIVTSSGGALVKDYTVTVNVTPASSAKDILTFSVGGAPATISGTDISLSVPYGSNLASLTPTYTVSAFASGSPGTGVAQNFNSPVIYTVTAEDNSTKQYTVTITERTYGAAYSINYNGYYQGGTADVTGTLGPEAANQPNWNNIHSGQSVNGGGGGNFDSSVTDSGLANPITLHTTFGNADGGNDGSGGGATDFDRLYNTGLRLGDVWCKATTDTAPFLTYDVYIYQVGKNFTVNGTNYAGPTGPRGSDFVLGQNYIKVTGLSGPLTLQANDAINGFSIVNTSTPPDPYLTWAGANGLTVANNDKSADPDFDGVVNALEYFLGGNPLGGDAPNMSSSIDGGSLVLNYFRNDDAESLNIVPQSSTVLSGWTTLADGVGGVSITVLENGASPDFITVMIPIGAEPKIFARLKFTP